jgi:protein-S-isoprenylcysteine O-methyltransferase Ste14
MKLNLVTMAVAMIGLSVYVMHTPHLPWTAWRIAGIAIAAPAFILFVAARIELGRAFSVQAKATTLVTTGIYSRIRNPIYVFGAILVLGFIIWMGRPWWLLIFVVIIPLQVVRSRKEERVLKDKFGAAYLDYKQKTWF